MIKDLLYTTLALATGVFIGKKLQQKKDIEEEMTNAEKVVNAQKTAADVFINDELFEQLRNKYKG